MRLISSSIGVPRTTIQRVLVSGILIAYSELPERLSATRYIQFLENEIKDSPQVLQSIRKTYIVEPLLFADTFHAPMNVNFKTMNQGFHVFF